MCGARPLPVRLVAPREEALPILGLGWSSGTPKGGVTAEVLVATDEASFEALGDRVRGRIVLHGGADVAFATNYGDTWEWNDTSWAQTSTGGPSARHGAGPQHRYCGRRKAAATPVRASVLSWGFAAASHS